MRRRGAFILATVAAVVAGSVLLASCGTSNVAQASVPPVRHVFIIVLENESASTTFGPHSQAPYLSRTLTAEGAYLPKYYATGHESNDNYISMVSGQAPNTQNQADCQLFDDVTPGTIGSYGQAGGEGCVYPPDVQTIAGQLLKKGLTWRDYNESMGSDPSREASECAHPGLNMVDNTQKATATDEYATRHNPFVYFHSIIDDTTLCDTHVVNLDLLPHDLASAAGTPNYVFITPDLCNDGHDSPCANGLKGGLPQADQFLREWVPRITRSPAFRQQNGLLLVTFDEAATSDTSSCCGEMPGPGSPKPGVTGPGGGDVGAVLISPCIAPHTVSKVPYNHYTMLRSIENIFGLTHLGYAALPGGQSFGSDIFNRRCPPSPTVHVRAPAIASSVAQTPHVRINWSASGPKARTFAMQVRQTSAGGRGWRTLLRATKRHSIGFSGRVGASYQFRVHATDTSNVTGAWAYATTVMPTGVRVAGGHYAGSWKIVFARHAWEHHAVESSVPGSTFTLSYTGGATAIIGERFPRGGVAQVVLDQSSRTIHLSSSRGRAHQVLYLSRVGLGHHRITIRVQSGEVVLEGLAIASRGG